MDWVFTFPSQAVKLPFILLSGLFWPLPPVLSAQEAENSRPNVLLILADDLGMVDLGCAGSADLATPALDALAARGVSFTQFYAAAPVCSPSRAAFLSGLIPERAGLSGNVDPNRPESGLPPSTVTIAEHFGAHGYATAHIGKWHLGHAPDRQPTGQGFDYSFGHLGGCIDNYSHFFYWNGPNRHDLVRNGVEVHAPGKYFPDLCVQEAAQWVSQHGKQPWLMYFAINLPHYPYQGKPKWLEHYADLPMPRREYAAFVSSMDEVIGELLTQLNELGELENTIVVFQSDHGHSTEQRAFYGGGSAGLHRGAKFSLLEGGLRVPAIVAGPTIPSSELRDAMATGCDWFPTLCEAVGLPQPKHPLDGKSLIKVLSDDQANTPHDSFFWKSGGQWAIRSGDWKLIYDAYDTTDGRNRKREPGMRLYNVADDPSESTNLASREAEVAARLKRLTLNWGPVEVFEPKDEAEIVAIALHAVESFYVEELQGKRLRVESSSLRLGRIDMLAEWHEAEPRSAVYSSLFQPSMRANVVELVAKIRHAVTRDGALSPDELKQVEQHLAKLRHERAASKEFEPAHVARSVWLDSGVGMVIVHVPGRQANDVWHFVLFERSGKTLEVAGTPYTLRDEILWD